MTRQTRIEDFQGGGVEAEILSYCLTSAGVMKLRGRSGVDGVSFWELAAGLVGNGRSGIRPGGFWISEWEFLVPGVCNVCQVLQTSRPRQIARLRSGGVCSLVCSVF